MKWRLIKTVTKKAKRYGILGFEPVNKAGDGTQEVMYWNNFIEDGAIGWYVGHRKADPTYWMPLPESPKASRT